MDIGAGTSDLMISRYSYTKGDVTTITPEPLFYDSYYYAGDEMLNELIRKIMFFSPNSAFRKKLKGLSETDYRQRLRNFLAQIIQGKRSLIESCVETSIYNILYHLCIVSLIC